MHYDDQFRALPGLTWLPWVGADFPELPPEQRLLIVGESHYTTEASPEMVPQRLLETIGLSTYTREIIQECPIDLEWRNPTLETVQRILLGKNAVDRAQLWRALCFFNFVQRPMTYVGRERPNDEDWISAWSVFIDVIRVLSPSHCVFLGVEASNKMQLAWGQISVPCASMDWDEKIGNTHPRSTSITIDGRYLPILFLKHPSQFFPWEEWHEYVKESYPEVVDFLKRRQVPLEGQHSVQE